MLLKEPHLELLEQVDSLGLEETPSRISSHTRPAADPVVSNHGPLLDVLEEEGSTDPSTLSDTVSEVKMPDDDSFLGG